MMQKSLGKTELLEKPDGSSGIVNHWDRVSAGCQSHIKTTLLVGITKEPRRDVRRTQTDLIAEIARWTMFHAADEITIVTLWPELMPFVFEIAQTPAAEYREVSYRLFVRLIDSLGDDLARVKPVAYNYLVAGIRDPANLQVRISAVTAWATYLTRIRGRELAQFGDTFQYVLELLNVCLNQSVDQAKLVLQDLIDLAEYSPDFVKFNAPLFLNAMLQICQHEPFDEGVRQLALEAILQFTRSKPPIVRKLGAAFLQPLLHLVMHFIVSVPEETMEEWNDDEEGNQYENMEFFDLGLEAIDRLAMALKGRTMLPILFPLFHTMLDSEDWRQRQAVMLALGYLAEGTAKVMKQNLPTAMNFVLSRFSDPHPRVRWAAAQCIGHLFTDCRPEVEVYIPQVLSAIETTLRDPLLHQWKRTLAYTVKMQVNVFLDTNADVLEPLVRNLAGLLVELLHSPHACVVMATVHAFAALANALGEKFRQYYPRVMPVVLQVLTRTVTPEASSLRAELLTFVGTIGVSVGAEMFHNDAKQVMEFMLDPRAAFDPSDPAAQTAVWAWAKIASSLKRDFEPYLPLILPIVFTAAERKPEFIVSDDADDVDEAEDFTFYPVGGKLVGVNNEVNNEKSNALELLAGFMDDLGPAFYPYAQRAAPLVRKLLNFLYSESVRESAAMCVMPLLSCVVEYNEANPANADWPALKVYLQQLLLRFFKAIRHESSVELLTVQVDHLRDVMERFASLGLDDATQEAFVTTVVIAFKNGSERLRSSEGQEHGVDYDEDDEEGREDEKECEDFFFSVLSDSITSVFKVHGEAFGMLVVHALLPTLLNYLQDKTSSMIERHAALCIIDDIIQYGGSKCHPVYMSFWTALHFYAQSDDLSLRKAAVYGIGMAAEQTGSLLASFWPESVNVIFKGIVPPDSTADNSIVFASDNAVSALLRILLFQSSNVNLQQLLPNLLSALPVKTDTDEMVFTYSNFARLVAAHVGLFAQVGGLDHALVVLYVGSMHAAEHKLTELLELIRAALQAFERDLPRDVSSALLGRIPPDMRGVLSVGLAAPQM
jgi:hypothetical protein